VRLLPQRHVRAWWIARIRRAPRGIQSWALGVPVRVKIGGMVLLPVLIFGIAVNFWVRGSLSDWLSWLLDSERVAMAMQSGGRSVLVVTVLAAGLSLFLTSALMLLLTTPILELKRVADLVRGGDLDERAPVYSGDEIGQVAEAFNRMVDELVNSQRELERSNRRLGAVCHVSDSVGRGLDLAIVLEAALNSTLDVTGLESGWIYLTDPESGRFYLACAVAPPGVVEAEPWSSPDAFCGCQRALLEEGEWNEPVQRECKRLALAAAQPGGDHPPHLSIPLRARGRDLGVLNLLWSKEAPARDEEIELIGALGVQVSEAVANARLHADLRDKEAGMEALLHSLVTAQEDERAVISSELHDGAGQELTSVLLRLTSLSAKDDISVLQAGISDLCVELSDAIEHIRSLSHLLRPPDLEQLGLGPTLRNLLTDMLGQNGMLVVFDSNLDGERLDPTLEITLYRIAQEALTNIARHACAQQTSLSVQLLDDELLLEIEDDGTGFDPDHLVVEGVAHIGLASIQERAERLGGSFVVRTGPGQGTHLTVRIPRMEVTA